MTSPATGLTCSSARSRPTRCVPEGPPQGELIGIRVLLLQMIDPDGGVQYLISYELDPETLEVTDAYCDV